MGTRFAGKCVIVTGGNLGIGKATSILLAEEGANVVIAARREEEGRAVVERIEAAGGSALFVRTDVAEAGDCEAVVNVAVDRFGRLDAAFNNAGVPQFGQSITELPIEEWDRVMNVNLRGVFLCMKYQMAAMIKVGGGSIVNTSSVGGLVAVAGLSAYQSSKHGLIGLTKVGALEGAPHKIRVNSLCPGATRSEMLNSWIESTEGLEATMVAACPLGRLSLPIEQARAALFLLSDEASYITGVSLPVDGGAIVP